MDCEVCPLQNECKSTKRKAVEDISPEGATHRISMKLQNYCPLKHGRGLDSIDEVRWALELKTCLDKEITCKLEGETVLDATKNSDRAMIMMEIAELLDGINLDV